MWTATIKDTGEKLEYNSTTEHKRRTISRRRTVSTK